MYARILISVAAWAAGAVVATAGSLLAISVLGQGIVTGPVRTLSVDEVASALAAVSATPSASATPTTSTAAAATGASDSPSSTATPSATPSASPSASPGTFSTKVLSSTGGSVIAACTQSGAYLSSWSPAQGFQVKNVVRGPAYAAKVKFVSSTTAVLLTVTCQSGVPTGSQTTSGSGDD